MTDRAYLRPGRLVTTVVNPLLMRLGGATTLAVRGRTSGQWRTVPVNVLELSGRRYLVSPRGETQWVRNLRSAGRSAVITAYRARWDRQVKKLFEQLPDPADHPVFLVTPSTG
ncbi:MAG TPA: hypothetical protein VKP11_00125 [Frankiaceae bacterium]|nr:hypothetical protein [Frankiaceae bacterium]